MAYAPRNGRNGKVLVDLGAGFVELPGIRDWNIDQGAERLDSTVMGSTFKTYETDTPDFKCQLNGFVDRDDDAVYAFGDGTDHEFVLYADRDAAPGKRHYWRGYVQADVSTKGGVGSLLGVTVNVTAGSGTGVNKYFL